MLAVKQVHEARLSMRAQRKDSPTGADEDLLFLQLGRAGRLVQAADVCRSVRVVESPRVGIVTPLLQLLELVTALGQRICEILHHAFPSSISFTRSFLMLSR